MLPPSFQRHQFPRIQIVVVVGLLVNLLPFRPLSLLHGEVLPHIVCLGVALGFQHGFGSHHDKGGVRNYHFRSLRLLLLLLQRVDVLGDCLEEVMHLAHIFHEDEDIELMDHRAQFLKVVQHRLGENLRLISLYLSPVTVTDSMLIIGWFFQAHNSGYPVTILWHM